MFTHTMAQRVLLRVSAGSCLCRTSQLDVLVDGPIASNMDSWSACPTSTISNLTTNAKLSSPNDKRNVLNFHSIIITCRYSYQKIIESALD